MEDKKWHKHKDGVWHRRKPEDFRVLVEGTFLDTKFGIPFTGKLDNNPDTPLDKR